MFGLRTLFAALIFLHSPFSLEASASADLRCIVLLQIRNGDFQENLTSYRRPNSRPSYDELFDHRLEPLLKKFKRESVYIDTGTGMGLSPLSYSLRYPGTFYGVNYQDFWAEFTDPKNRAIALNMIENRKLESLLGAEPNPQVRSLGESAFLQHRIDLVAAKVRALQEKKRFQYVASSAEKFLSSPGPQADLITDVWGAYFYSHPRHQVIELIYRRLKPGGTAFVMLRNNFDPNNPLSRMGPRDTVTWLQEGQRKSLVIEEYLAKTYPDLFENRNRYLVIKKKAEIPILDLMAKLKVASEHDFAFHDTILREAAYEVVR